MTTPSIRVADKSCLEDFELVRMERGGEWKNLRKSCFDELSFPHYGSERIIFLAYVGGIAVGYGRAMQYRYSRDGNLYSTTSLLPEGWYLRGVVVKPQFRKTGIARALTKEMRSGKNKNPQGIKNVKRDYNRLKNEKK